VVSPALRRFTDWVEAREREQQERGKSRPVTDVMIPEHEFIAYDIGPTDHFQAVRLADISTRMQGISPPAARIPIRDATGAVRYIIQDSH
jgi:hypothetical protein